MTPFDESVLSFTGTIGRFSQVHRFMLFSQSPGMLGFISHLISRKTMHELNRKQHQMGPHFGQNRI